MIKSICENPTTSSIRNGEIFNALALKSGKKQGCTLLPLIFNIALNVIASIIMQEKNKQTFKRWKEKSKTAMIHRWYNCVYINSKEAYFFLTLIYTITSCDTFLGYSLYRGGLEQNPQYFWDMLVCHLNFLTTKIHYFK